MMVANSIQSVEYDRVNLYYYYNNYNIINYLYCNGIVDMWNTELIDTGSTPTRRSVNTSPKFLVAFASSITR